METKFSLPAKSNLVQSIPWQLDASVELCDKLVNYRGVLLRAGTGLGKMYMAAEAIRTMYLDGKLVNPVDSINPFVVLWLTPKSVKAQTQTVLHQYGLTRIVHVMSYSELRSSMGAMYITWVRDSDTGEDNPVWNTKTLVALVKCDECQLLKNPFSLQARVVRALPSCAKSLFASATPYQRVSDAQSMLEVFSASTKYNSVPATKETSEKILAYIASPKRTDEYSPSAVERLHTELENYTVEVKNVRFKYKAITKCVDIHFKSLVEKQTYDKLVQTLIENLKRRKGQEGELTAIHILVEMQKMQQGAELLRVPHICERVITNLPTRAVIVASNFVDTIKAILHELVHLHNIPESRIAVVIGGQDMTERQKMVNDFQAGRRDIILFTMRSGGVGISLHNDRTTTKPRHIILPPTWSAIDLVQALGRGHRLTSLSETTQEILWYADTIETAVKLRVELKIKCLSKAVVAKEQFVDTFISQVGEKLDTDDLVEQQEELRHAGEDSLNTDDLDSKDDEDSITGEGLSNEDDNNKEQKQLEMAI